MNSLKKNPKVHFIAQGHRDCNNDNTVYDVSTFKSSSILLLFLIAAICSSQMFLYNVTQKYFQRKEKRSREIFLRLKPEDCEVSGIKNERILDLFGPRYGLCIVDNYWAFTMEAHPTNELKMRPFPGDGLFFMMKKIKHSNGLQIPTLMIASMLAPRNRADCLKRFRKI